MRVAICPFFTANATSIQSLIFLNSFLRKQIYTLSWKWWISKSLFTWRGPARNCVQTLQPPLLSCRTGENKGGWVEKKRRWSWRPTDLLILIECVSFQASMKKDFLVFLFRIKNLKITEKFYTPMWFWWEPVKFSSKAARLIILIER